MLELGPDGPDLHAGLLESLTANGVDRVYCAGPLMKALWQVLPRAMRGAYADSSASLETILIEELRAGDAVMVKGSFGSRMGPLVEGLIRRFGTDDGRGV
jgi:UDP-N-acetylmuramyl pentapeptide synthase